MKCIDILMKEYKGLKSIRGQLEEWWYFKMTAYFCELETIMEIRFTE